MTCAPCGSARMLAYAFLASAVFWLTIAAILAANITHGTPGASPRIAMPGPAGAGSSSRLAPAVDHAQETGR